jgi:hypothetical protein
VEFGRVWSLGVKVPIKGGERVQYLGEGVSDLVSGGVCDRDDRALCFARFNSGR